MNGNRTRIAGESKGATEHAIALGDLLESFFEKFEMEDESYDEEVVRGALLALYARQKSHIANAFTNLNYDEPYKTALEGMKQVPDWLYHVNRR